MDLDDMEGVGSDAEEDQQQSGEDTLSGVHTHASINAQEPDAKATGCTTYNVAGQEDWMVEDEPSGD